MTDKGSLAVSSRQVEPKYLDTPQRVRQPGTIRKARFIVGTIVLLSIVALALGLGIGLTRSHAGDGEVSEPRGNSPPTSNGTHATNDSTSTNRNESNSTTWQPSVGTTWQIQLLNPVTDFGLNVSVYDIDLFDNSADTLLRLHNLGRKVICYCKSFTAFQYTC